MSLDDAFLQGLQSQFPDSTWYVYAGLVLQANDQMHLIGRLWEYVKSRATSGEELLAMTRKLREGFLKSSSLVGFPKARYNGVEAAIIRLIQLQGINACQALRNAIQTNSPDVVEELDRDSSLRKHLSREEKNVRGKAFFSKIYAQHTDRVLRNMSLASGGDLSEYAINAIYGDLMAEESILSARETGLLEFLVCYAAGGAASQQAKGHLYGCHHLGNGRAEIQGAIEICRAIEKQLGLRVNREPAADWTWVSKADQW